MVLASDAAQSPGDVMRRLTDLERAVRELSAARRLEASSIGAGGLTIRNGGGITVEEGGTIEVKAPDGTVIVRMGLLDTIIGGEPVYGTQLKRIDGTTAIGVYGATLEGAPSVGAMLDNSVEVIVTDDSVSNQGLARPYLSSGPVGLAVNTDTRPLIPASASASFVSLWEGWLPLTHPKLRFRCVFDNNDGASLGEGRVLLDGVQIGSTASVPASGGVVHTEYVSVPGWGSTVAFLQEAKVEVQVRRTSGTGKILAELYGLYGVQS